MGKINGYTSNNSDKSNSHNDTNTDNVNNNNNDDNNNIKNDSDNNKNHNVAVSGNTDGWRPLLYVNYHQKFFHDPKNWNDKEKLFQ
jgi:hypothetical protein